MEENISTTLEERSKINNIINNGFTISQVIACLNAYLEKTESTLISAFEEQDINIMKEIEKQDMIGKRIFIIPYLFKNQHVLILINLIAKTITAYNSLLDSPIDSLPIVLMLKTKLKFDFHPKNNPYGLHPEPWKTGIYVIQAALLLEQKPDIDTPEKLTALQQKITAEKHDDLRKIDFSNEKINEYLKTAATYQMLLDIDQIPTQINFSLWAENKKQKTVNDLAKKYPNFNEHYLKFFSNQGAFLIAQFDNYDKFYGENFISTYSHEELLAIHHVYTKLIKNEMEESLYEKEVQLYFIEEFCNFVFNKEPGLPWQNGEYFTKVIPGKVLVTAEWDRKEFLKIAPNLYVKILNQKGIVDYLNDEDFINDVNQTLQSATDAESIQLIKTELFTQDQWENFIYKTMPIGYRTTIEKVIKNYAKNLRIATAFYKADKKEFSENEKQQGILIIQTAKTQKAFLKFLINNDENFPKLKTLDGNTNILQLVVRNNLLDIFKLFEEKCDLATIVEETGGIEVYTNGINNTNKCVQELNALMHRHSNP